MALQVIETTDMLLAEVNVRDVSVPSIKRQGYRYYLSQVVLEEAERYLFIVDLIGFENRFDQ